ncbi:hypothetical protein AX17_006262 [Amanita inopinata Kibby_2008]|nr:hypothetical protein AX17_006262 [Amanita inopinata Kibby_2008]
MSDFLPELSELSFSNLFTSHFPRTNPPPWPQRAVSVESLAAAARASSSLAAGPALKKRHSAYALSHSPPDIPELPIPHSQRQQHLQPPDSIARPGVTVKHHLARPKPNRRPSQPTASREEITPWEFYQVPSEYDATSITALAPSSIRSRASLSTGLVEEVTPWELYPVPQEVEPPEHPAVHRSKRSRLGRPSSSSGTNKTLADFGIGSRRKTIHSINNSKLTANSSPRAPVSSSSVFNDTASYSSLQVSSSSVSIHLPSPSMPRSPLPSKFLSLKKTPSSSKLDTPPNGADPRFSTADRKILEELKRNITAREAQFIKKGKSAGFGASGVVPGKKHHPYPRHIVPYPRNYEREVLDLDVWETAFCHDICGSITWHVFKTPPTRVLDLGCGTGSWILSCAKVWKECQFVGLDIVPLHPDLQQIGSPDLASRITWVQANFLDKLPFPNEEFDYVHVKRIALGVPEDKWDPLLEEITRVMKPGAAFELIEEDLFFPGKQTDSDCESEDEEEDVKPPSWHTLNVAEDHSRTSESQLLVPPRTDDEYSTPTTAGSVLPLTPSRPSSPVPIREVAIAEADEPEGDEQVRYQELDHTHTPSASNNPTPTPTRPPLHVKTGQHNEQPSHHNQSQHQYQGPFRPFLHMQPKRSTSTLSLPTSTKAGISPIHVPNKVSGDIPSIANPTSPDSNALYLPVPMTPIEDSSSHLQVDIPDLLRTLPKPPVNPRDHTMLEMIYTEMLASRFINTSPLSLLANLLSLHLKDLRTHPPIQFTFPPLPRKYRIFGKIVDRDKNGEVKKKDDSSIVEDVAKVEKPEIEEEARFLSMQALLQHESRYVSLDETRPTAFSPSTRASFFKSNRDMKVAAIKRASRLPNAQLHLDLKTLNLHLALRTAEVLACSESMWEWVLEQKMLHNAPGRNRLNSQGFRPRMSMSSGESTRSTEEAFREKIADMKRDDFDELLNNLRLDMQDKFVLGYALQDRFDWGISLCQAPPDRVGFDGACEKWRNWELQEREIQAMPQRPSFIRGRAVSTSNLSTHSSPQVGRTHSGSSGLAPPVEEDRLRGEHSDVRNGCHASNESLVSRQNGRTRVTSRATLIPPTSRLSRAIRVFVGWKP